MNRTNSPIGYRLIAMMLLLTSISAYAQSGAMSEQGQKVFEEILKLRFEEAGNHLEAYPHSSVWMKAESYYLLDYMAFLKIFIGEQVKDFDHALTNRNAYMDYWNELPDDSPEKSFYLADSYLRWALLRGKFGERFRPAVEINKSFKLFSENQERFPDYIPARSGLGVLETIVGTIPERYQWVMKLLNLEGTIDSGKEKIHAVLKISEEDDKYAYLHKSTLFMLSFIDMNMSEKVNKQLTNRFEKMYSADQLSDQPLMIFMYADLLQKQQENDKAQQVLNLYTLSDDAYPFYYIYYMKGISALFNMDSACITSFQVFLENFQGQHYLKAAYRDLAWYALLSGDTAGYHHHLSQVDRVGKKIMGADKMALHEWESEEMPAIQLLKARLLFDGGYFLRALEALDSPGFIARNIKEQTEYLYRKGRVFHGLEDYPQALAYYQQAYKKGSDLDAYYAANAMLMSGRIHALKKQWPLANESYENCLDLSGFQYQYSIHQKAKAGLEQVKVLMKQ